VRLSASSRSTSRWSTRFFLGDFVLFVMDASAVSAHLGRMKATYLHTAGAIALTFGLGLTLAACVPKGEAPVTALPPVVQPTPAPPPVVREPVYTNWLDAPQTPGDWRYQQSAGGPVAVYIGRDGSGDFVMGCNRARASIDLWRAGTSAGPRTMRLLTETAARTVQVVQAEDTNPYLMASLPARDPLFDAMALSKGRFAVEVEGQPTLYLPSWAEVTRVIEDCR
jgi:hypothetical protein